MPDYGKRTGRDAFESLERRLAAAERELRRARGGGLSTIDRGDTGSQPAPVEGQTMVQYDTDTTYIYSNGTWRPLGAAKIGLAFFNGASFPAAGTHTVEVRVPYDRDGSIATFTLDELWARRDVASAADTTFTLEKYSGTGAFAATTVATVTIAAGHYEDTSTTFAVATLTSNDKLRIVFTAVGAGGGGYQLQLRGRQD